MSCRFRARLRMLNNSTESIEDSENKAGQTDRRNGNAGLRNVNGAVANH
jgi:hypothetical protein